MSGSAPVAALPMYDFPEIAAANDALWRRISAGLRSGWRRRRRSRAGAT